MDTLCVLCAYSISNVFVCVLYSYVIRIGLVLRKYGVAIVFGSFFVLNAKCIRSVFVLHMHCIRSVLVLYVVWYS